MPTTVLATKLFAPAGRRRVVARSRLTERLDGIVEPGRKLALVSAPAGFGKTTLVTDWIEHGGQRSAQRVAWLSLDSGDNDLPRLLTHLVAALQGAGADISADTIDLLAQGSATPASAALTGLVNDLAGLATPVVLVLDDYHVLDAPAAHEAMAFLVEHLPPQLRLVITTRADPPFALTRLRARDELVELRATDLRFTPDEAGSFLNQVMGLDLAADDVEALEARTEGWIAGLQLAGLSLQGRADVSGFIGEFTGSHRFVLDYLVDEVLQHQPQHLRDFLLHTAVLDRLSGPLCDAVTGRTDSSTMLEILERSNLFVVALDEDRAWFRYHHLFADTLRARALTEQPDVAPVSHHRASAWFERQGMVEDAVRHALSGRDFERAAHLVELALPALRRDRRDTTLVGWLDALPDDVVRRSAVLSVFAGWVRLVAGDIDAVEERLDDAERALAAGPSADAANEELRTLPATLAIYRASLAQARGDAAGTASHARRALDLAEPGDHFSRGSAAGFLGLAAWAAGEVQPALQTFSEAVRSLRKAGNLADALGGTVVLADMWVAAGRPDRARRLYEEALLETESLEGHGARPTLPVADLHVGLAELAFELGDLAGASRHLEAAERVAERAVTNENRHRWFVVKARLREAADDAEGAIDLLHQAEAHYRRGFFPEVRPIAAMRARVRIRQGLLPEAAEWASEHAVSTAEDLNYLREFDHLTLVRLLLAQHRNHDDHAALRTAADLLERLHEAAAGSARTGSVIECLLLHALVHEAQGHREAAVDTLERVLGETPLGDGPVRLYLDEGAPMTSLLRACAARDAAGERARRILEVAAKPPPDALPQRDAKTSPLPEPLSERELQVLRLLDSTLTGPEIARELFVSHNTLRTHTKHIFTKLGVNSRPAAVGRAKEHGLL